MIWSGGRARALTAEPQPIDLVIAGRRRHGGRLRYRTFERGEPLAEIARVGADATAYTDGGLTARTGYRYPVRAFNAAGYSAYSNTARVRTPRQ